MGAPAGSTAPPRQQAKTVKALSGMRGVAALSVVLLHFNYDEKEPLLPDNYGLNELGHVAVTFFFILSSFLLTYRGIKEPSSNQVKYVTIKNRKIPIFSMRWFAYAVRRLFRIYPPYFLIIMIACLVPRYKNLFFDYRKPWGEGPLTAADIPNYLFLNDVNSIFWTIPPELEFYLFLPVIIMCFQKAEKLDMQSGASSEGNTDATGRPLFRFTRVIMRTCHVAAFSILAWGFAPLLGFKMRTKNAFHIFYCFGTFWCGSITAIILHTLEMYGCGSSDVFSAKAKKSKEDYDKLPVKTMMDKMTLKFFTFLDKAVPVICDLGCWGILLGTILSFPYYQKVMYGVADVNAYKAALAANEEFLAALLVFLVCWGPQNTSFANCFQWNVFMWAGEISFPIYLFHPLAIFEAFKANLKALDTVALIYILTYLMGTAIHYLVEKPFMNMGNSLIRWMRAKYFPPPRKVETEQKKEDNSPPDGTVLKDSSAEQKNPASGKPPHPQLKIDNKPNSFTLDVSPNSPVRRNPYGQTLQDVISQVSPNIQSTNASSRYSVESKQASNQSNRASNTRGGPNRISKS